NQYTHLQIPSGACRFHGLARTVIEIVGSDDVEAAVGKHFLALVHVSSFQPDDQRNLHFDILDRIDDAFGNGVAAHDATEDIDQNGLDLVVGENQLERLLDALGVGAATDVEKVGRLTARQFDHVHGRHGQTGPVDHASDVAVEGDVVQIVLAGGQLGRIFLRLIAHLGDIGVAKQRVVVGGQLGVERAQIAVAVDDQRVDLDEIDVLFHEQSIEAAHDLDQLLDLLGVEPHAIADMACLIGHEARGGVHRRGDDLFGRVGGNLFDIDPASG